MKASLLSSSLSGEVAALTLEEKHREEVGELQKKLAAAELAGRKGEEVEEKLTFLQVRWVGGWVGGWVGRGERCGLNALLDSMGGRVGFFVCIEKK